MRPLDCRTWGGAMFGGSGRYVHGGRWHGSGSHGQVWRGLSAAVVAVLGAGFLVATPVAAAPTAKPGHAHPDPATRVRSVPVRNLAAAGGSPVLQPGPGSIGAPVVSWPAAASAQVDASAQGSASGTHAVAAPAWVSVGGLPVAVLRPSGTTMAASAGPTRGSVAVAGHGVAQAAGGSGVVGSLGRADGQAAAARVRLSVDYSKFGNNFGGGFGSRLHPVAMPSCVLSTPDVPACRGPAPIPGFANDEQARVGS